MCGFAGLAYLDGKPVPTEVLDRMGDVLSHRGPDARGRYQDGSVGLVHTRLAIIDLSSKAAQPMRGSGDEQVVVYNGEIYNFRELRSDLEGRGHRFVSRSDTEVLLQAYREWGEDCVHRFNGMFAFAVLDRSKRKLFLARDRYGIKPLYWFRRGGVFAFGSEIKALLKEPSYTPAVSPEALSEYLTFQNVFSDLTLFDGVHLLPPASKLVLELKEGAVPKADPYWDYSFADPYESASMEECAEGIRTRFEAAVQRQMVSDVPVGSYLSGGMDSGSIAALASRSVNRLSTFTCGFDLTSASGIELAYDERSAAEVMANRLKTEHYEVVLHAGDMEWVLPELVWHLEDLRVGQSYPNYYVARLASRFVKVVLSGAGGDELFGGYPWRYFRGIESSGQGDYLARYFDYWQRLVPEDDRAKLYQPNLGKQVASYSSFDVFRSIFSRWPGSYGTTEDRINASLYFELKTFMHGLLVVEDKLSMAHSLETRVPFLDNELVDYALRVPVRHKLRNLDSVGTVDENQLSKRLLYYEDVKEGKTVLRKAMAGILPGEVAGRAKQGFSAPDATWFRGESIEYINRFLRDPKAKIFEYVRPEYVYSILDQHTSGKQNRRLLIWSFLCLEWWLRCFLGGEIPEERLMDYHHPRGRRPIE